MDAFRRHTRWIAIVSAAVVVLAVAAVAYPPSRHFIRSIIVRPPASPPQVRVTFVEGATLPEMAALVARSLPGVTEQDFLAAAKGQEGYLFPDTYFFQPGDTASAIVSRMRADFDARVASLLPGVRASGHSLRDVVIMASIIEGEAKTPADRRMVSGILWNRIAKGMRLQADAAPETYAHAGLPAEPINEPGLDSLDAAVHPASTSFLYYLTGRDGLMHYASTYAGHQANLRKYLQ